MMPESTGQVVIMLGQPTIPHGHQDDLALRLLNCYIGVGMSSLLFRELREKHGVAYDVGVHHPARRGASPFLLHVSTSDEKALLTLQLLEQIWESLKQEPLSNEELRLTRAKYRGQIAHGSHTISQRAARKVQLRGLNLRDDYDTRNLMNIDLISSTDLQITAQKHLNNPLLSLCGPKPTIEKLGKHWLKNT